MFHRKLSRREIIGTAVAANAAFHLATGWPSGAAATDNSTASQPSGETGYDDQQHTNRLLQSVSRRHSFQGDTMQQWRQWQESFRPRLRELLGLAAMEREVRFERQAQRVESIARDGYTQEKWYLWTEPDVPLPVWALIPDKPAARPLPLILTPHGHNVPEIYLGAAKNDAERNAIAQGERDIAVQAVREGYLCIHPTARGFGETIRSEDRKKGKINSCRTGLMHAMLFGRTMIGYRVWDISRIIDWAVPQFGVDPRRIAVTGNSGGGTTTLFAAACDERISVAVPSSYFCTFAASIGSIYHCECNYVPGLLCEGEMYDVAGLIAPRWFRAIAGKDDPIFPIAGVRESFDQLKKVYRAAGADGRCELYVGQGGHRYYREGAWPFVRKAFADLVRTG